MRIDRPYIQSSNLQKTESTETQTASTTQTPSEQSKAVSSPVKNSTNTWQRGGLVQDGSMKQSMLNHELTVAQTYGQTKAEIARDKEAKESNSSLMGTIFGGPVIGTLIGEAIGTEASRAEQNPIRDLLGTFEKEADKISEQLDKIYDEAFIETAGGSSSPVGDLKSVASTKVSYDDDDD